MAIGVLPSRRGVLIAGLVAATLGAWAVSVGRMRGMDAGPGTDLGCVMSLVWMLVVALAILVEKTRPGGPRAAPALAAALVVLGLWVAVRPASVPGLTQPHAMEMMHR